MVGSTYTVDQKRVILFLCRARQCCFSMCVLSEVNFINVKLHSLYLNRFSSCGWLRPHSWPKKSNSHLFLPRARQRPLFMCVSNMFNFAIKLHSLHLNCFCFTWLAPSIKMLKKSNSVFTQGKTMLSLHVRFECV